jgi:hypothetical protein
MPKIYQIFDRNNNIDAKDLPKVVCSWMDEHFPEPTHPSFCKFLLQELRNDGVDLFDTITIELYKQLLQECAVRCYTKESCEVLLEAIEKIREKIPHRKEYMDFLMPL